MDYNEFVNFMVKHEKVETVRDGVYDITDIDFVIGKKNDYDNIVKWLENKDKFWLANAYETDYYILFAEEPKKFNGKQKGEGFNYGSTSMLLDCPKDVLILAEND